MRVFCSSPGCKATVPVELKAERLCALHFTLSVEQTCAEMRRETAVAAATAERRADIARYIASSGEKLAHLATGSEVLPDEMKGRILSTFLTLMNLRENLDRAARRAAAPGAHEAVG